MSVSDHKLEVCQVQLCNTGPREAVGDQGQVDGATGQNRDGLSGNLHGVDAFLNHREDRGIFSF